MSGIVRKDPTRKRITHFASRLPILIAALLLVSFPGRSFAQVNVTGAQINEAAATATIYVDQHHPKTSDSNVGTADLPMRTISRAVERAAANNKAGIGTKIIVAPGTYREEVRVRAGTRPNNAPLIIEAAEPGKTIISGSDVFTNWTKRGTGIYTMPWNRNWGMAKDPWSGQYVPVMSDLARRREMVFVDGTLMRQYLSHKEMSANPGSFYVDEANKLLYVHAPGNGDLTKSKVEVATRAVALNINGQRNVVLRGLVFQHAASPVPDGAVYVGDSEHILIEDCAFQWNNWTGFKPYQVYNLTVRRSTANYNGVMGMGGSRVKNFIFEDVEANYNNLWRGGEWGQYYEPWATAGSKWLSMHNGIFRRYTTSHNEIVGFWVDADNQDILIDGLVSHDNRDHGLLFEINQGPISVRNSIISFNRSEKGGGVRIANTRNFTFERNIVYGNRGPQFFSPNRSLTNRRRCVTDWETNVQACNTSGDWVLRNNVFVATGSDQSLGDVPFALPPDQIIDNIDSNNNLWYHPNGQNAFLDKSKSVKSLADWQNRWQSESSSIFTNPRFKNPQALDFSLLPGSPVRGWGLPLGTGIPTEDAIAKDDRVLHLMLNEGSGTTTSDVSGNSLHGQLVNQPTWIQGVSGKALSFDGKDDHVKVAKSSAFDLTESLTLMAWFNHKSSGGDDQTGIEKPRAYRLLAREANGAASFWIFDFWSENGSYQRLTTTSAISNNEWHHIAATFDGETMRIYVDGVLNNSQRFSGRIRKVDSAFQLGIRDGIRFFAGAMDEVRLYGRALTADEIRQIAQGEEAALASKTAEAEEEAAAAVDVQDADALPGTFALEPNFPNPFNPTTVIQYSLPEAAQVRLEVFDMLGRRVAVLADTWQTSGTHQVTFDATQLASGAYLYRIQAGDFVMTRQMMLMK